jgi:hypothetical protein
MDVAVNGAFAAGISRSRLTALGRWTKPLTRWWCAADRTS